MLCLQIHFKILIFVVGRSVYELLNYVRNILEKHYVINRNFSIPHLIILYA